MKRLITLRMLMAWRIGRHRRRIRRGKKQTVKRALAAACFLAALLLLVPQNANAIDGGLWMDVGVRHTNHDPGMEAGIYWGFLGLACILTILCVAWLAGEERGRHFSKTVSVVSGVAGIAGLVLHIWGYIHFTSTELQPDHVKASIMMGVGVLLFLLGFIMAVAPTAMRAGESKRKSAPLSLPDVEGKW